MMKRMMPVCSMASFICLISLNIGQIDASTVKASHFKGFSDDEGDDEDGDQVRRPLFFNLD